MLFKVKRFTSAACIITIFALYFSESKSESGIARINSNGKSVQPENKYDAKYKLISGINKADSNRNKKNSSLDGDQNIKKPGNEPKPFDPSAPFTKLTFRMLRTYIPGKQCPEDLMKLNFQNVEILGFMTPLNALTDMDEFLLCSAPPLSCYCAPPIFINEMVYVKLIDKRTDFKTGAVKIKGQLNINLDVKDEYSDIIYSISASDID